MPYDHNDYGKVLPSAVYLKDKEMYLKLILALSPVKIYRNCQWQEKAGLSN